MAITKDTNIEKSQFKHIMLDKAIVSLINEIDSLETILDDISNEGHSEGSLKKAEATTPSFSYVLNNSGKIITAQTDRIKSFIEKLRQELF